MLGSQNSSRPTGIECLHANFSSRLDEIGSRLSVMEPESNKHSVEFILQEGSRQLSRPVQPGSYKQALGREILTNNFSVQAVVMCQFIRMQYDTIIGRD